MNIIEQLIKKRRKKINTLFIVIYMAMLILGALFLKMSVLAVTIFVAMLVLPLTFYMQSINEERRFILKVAQLNEKDMKALVKEYEKPLIASRELKISNSCIISITFRKCIFIDYRELSKVDIDKEKCLLKLYSNNETFSFTLNSKDDLIKAENRIKSRSRCKINY